ncbi:MAG TPA: hypothetical protein VF503_18035 [Sphingobium sp.]|uniref:hypothetical protein n=1 Tax=Sphingobium sp. TaxID=1912891 RepID=UPI002ED1EB71
MTLHDHLFYLSMALASLLALAIVASATLRGWRDWLSLKRAELDRFVGGAGDAPARLPSAERIEMADLKERIRKLEAIAAGVDL